MDVLNRDALGDRAGRALSSAVFPPKRLALIHSAVSVLPALILAGISLLLASPLESTGGLSGIRTRDILETVQTLLTLIPSLLMPFWSIGFLYSSMRILRGQEAGPKSLLEGFRRLGPVLRLNLLLILICYGLGMACAFVGTFIATPFSLKLATLLTPLLEATSEAQIDAILSGISTAELLSAMLPMLLTVAGLCILVFVPLFYRLRLAQYVILEDPQRGALAAMAESMRLTKKHCTQLLRLDLRFWWYHLISLLLAMLAYGDYILPALGVDLPFSPELAYMLFYCLYAAGTIAQHYAFRPQVTVTYAAAYDTLRTPPQQLPNVIEL